MSRSVHSPTANRLQDRLGLPPGSGVLTSESVTGGHPDKVADQVSDAVLDAHLAGDPCARVACETLVTTDLVVLAGEISSQARVDAEAVARRVIRDIGYDRPGEGFDADTCEVQVRLHGQAHEIAEGVDTGGAGDQGMMLGYATDETPELMPLPISLAHRITRRLGELRTSGELPWLRPDGKAQVSVEYRPDGPPRISAVVVSTQHERGVALDDLRRAIGREVVSPVIAGWQRSPSFQLHVNPAGTFIEGGPATDTGLTGRKIIVDTYGGAVSHGGGAFSGKDATKVDRSGAYMARHVARSLVAAGFSHRALVQIAYAIGRADPVAVAVSSLGTGTVPDAELTELVRSAFDLTPNGIIAGLDLRRPVYLPTAAGGHFGRTGPGFTWETNQPLKRSRPITEITASR